MLPETQNLPSRRHQTPIGVGVTLSVRLELRGPPGLVGLGESGVNGARVPEASIDVDSDSLAGKHDIRSTPDTLDGRDIDAVTKSRMVQGLPQRKLWGRISLTSTQHPLACGI